MITMVLHTNPNDPEGTLTGFFETELSPAQLREEAVERLARFTATAFGFTFDELPGWRRREILAGAREVLEAGDR